MIKVQMKISYPAQLKDDGKMCDGLCNYNWKKGTFRCLFDNLELKERDGVPIARGECQKAAMEIKK